MGIKLHFWAKIEQGIAFFALRDERKYSLEFVYFLLNIFFYFSKYISKVMESRANIMAIVLVLYGYSENVAHACRKRDISGLKISNL